MIATNSFRLLTYQAQQTASPVTEVAPTAAPTVAPAATAAPAVAPASVPTVAPTAIADMAPVVAQISQALTTIQEQAQSLIDSLTSRLAPVASTVTPAPAPAPAPAPPKTEAPAPKPSKPKPSKPKPAPKQPQKAAAKPADKTHGSPWKPGPGQLKGADTSHYQSDSTFADTIKNAKWSAIKATQGTHYVDPTYKARWNELGKKVESGSMKLRVAYHYLDPGNGAAQAKHFLDTLGVDGPLPDGTRLALDWEGPALGSPGTLRDAANYIHKVTGLWPLVYVQGSKVSVAKQTVPHAPIWEAAWSSHIDKSVPFVQYSDGPVYDHDVFNGTVAALKRFAGYA
jgi:GH25 family lysozyme M1 (1,4-beta-N-acetylmuramidase)